MKSTVYFATSLMLVGVTLDAADSPWGEVRWIDLTHDFSLETIFWPTDTQGFVLEEDFKGMTDKGYYYSSNKYRAAEHGGTHIDAPIHFAKGRQALHEIPLERLTGPAAVIDVRRHAMADKDYQVTVRDLTSWEEKNGPLAPGVIVLLQTGFDQYWPDAEQYLGTADRGPEAIPKLHFPGLHPSAAKWLVENRSIDAIGIDTASIDFGQSELYESHQILFQHEIPAFENVTQLGKLPATGAYVIALPMKIRGGSGGPLRIVAALPAIQLTSVPFAAPKGEYVSSQDRYHTFRIPGMVVTQDGTILLFAEARRGDGSDPRKDENAPIDLVMRRSTDNGDTWEPIVVIESGFRSNGDLVDFADPTPVLDATTGTVFLLYGQWPDLAPTTVAHGQDPNSAEGNQVVWVRSSSDNGKTWSDRKQVVYPDEPHETSDGLYWRQAEPGPGSGIQLQWQNDAALNGRLIIPAKRSGSKTPDGKVSVKPFVYYSDDHGETWKVGNITPGPDANEDEVVELTNGSVLLDGRPNSGYLRRRHRSYDGGVTWGPDIPDTIALTPVDGSMIRYSARRAGHDLDRILFSAPQGEAGLNRSNITIWTSYNEGKSFKNPVQINTGFAAYSVLQRLHDGSIGLVVETAKDAGVRYGEITFYRIDIAQLEDNRVSQ